MIDLIGDIHGHADQLEALLQKLGYTKTNGAYAHPEHTVLFVGDYIDRGPKIRETLEIVKAMVDSGNAIALIGNHQFKQDQLKEIKALLSRYFAEKASEEMDKLWDEHNWTNETMREWAQEHMRTKSKG